MKLTGFVCFCWIFSSEYCGPLCAQYQHIFLQPLLEYTKDKTAEVRQAATYGCGVLAQVRICRIPDRYG